MQDAEDLIRWAAEHYRGRLATVTSFQREGMVLLDMAQRISPGIPVFTLDTGRLPESTYEMIERVRTHYGVSIHLVHPDAGEVERMTTAHGPNLFRNDLGSRLLCCQIRKVRPLAKALAPFSATLVGLRRAQTESRAQLEQIDSRSNPVKISPLAEWTSEQVATYIAAHNVPEHPLYRRGYRSIGCEPCTRAVQPDEGERAGRWWWEQDAAKECGLHFTPEGRVRRRVDILLEEVLHA